MDRQPDPVDAAVLGVGTEDGTNQPSGPTEANHTTADDLLDADAARALTTGTKDQPGQALEPSDVHHPDRSAGRPRKFQPPEKILALVDGHRATDAGNAARFAELYDSDVRYVHAWQKWIVYSAGRWVVDTGEALVTECARFVPHTILRRAVDLEMNGSDGREAMAKWALRSESATAIANMLRLARGRPEMLVEHSQLDADPWLLNVLNGTIDLRTGDLRPHSPDDLLTLRAPVRYDPDATAPLWDACIERWQPDDRVRAFLQRAVGTAAIGHPLEALLVNVGDGANGKSRFSGAVTNVLGPYAVVPHKSLVVTSKHEGHPTHVASLFKARMLCVPETSEGDRLDEEMVKGLTGGDTLRARRMREDEWSFEPSWTAWMHTNYPPQIRGTDVGIWRRVRLIPWEVTIPADERDEHLADKLAAEASGILNWIIQGALDWQERGLDEPDSVKVATEAYRTESDTVARFLDETGLVFDQTATVAASRLAALHVSWFGTAGIGGPEPAHYQRLVHALKERGASNRRTSRGRFWEGIGESQ